MCCPALARGGVVARGHRRAHGSSSSCRRARYQWHWLEPPFSSTRTAVGFDVAAVDLGGLGDPAFLGQSRQDARPDAAMAPSVPTVVHRRRRPVLARAVLPATAAFEHVDDPRDNPSIIDAPRSRLVFGEMRFDRRPRHIRQPKQRTRHSRASFDGRSLESMGQPFFKRMIGFGP